MKPLARVAAIVLAVSLLGGCAAKTSVDQATGTELQASVISIANLAAAGDPTSALAQLQALESALLLATTEGRVSGERSAEITSAIALVRSDLTAAVEAQSVPGPTETSELTDETGNGNGNGNGNKNGKKDK